MRFGYFMAAIAIVPGAAHAANWRFAGGTSASPAEVAFVDTDSIIRRSSGNIDLDVVVIQAGDSLDTYRKWEKRLSVNCKANQVTVESFNRYTGRRLMEQDTNDKGPYTPPAVSIDAKMLSAVCGKTAYQSETIADPDSYASDYFSNLAN